MRRPDSAPPTAAVPPARQLARSGPVWLLVLAVATIAFLTFGSEGRADSEDAIQIHFVSVTGEGPSAKAWYDGAPPAGVPVQDALDYFAKRGYRVATVTEPHPSSAGTFAFNILLQRVAP